MTEQTFRDTPYKGLVPYSEEDAPFFFGREAEREIITANLMASRLTLLYGASGVGKSSVLRAGVAHNLRQLAQKNLSEHGAPEFGVLVFNSWRDNPVEVMERRLDEALSSLVPNGTDSPADGVRELPEILEAWSRKLDGDLFIILDQFEEYFLYHAQEDGDNSFAVQFPRAVNRSDLRVSFLISIREDALAKLDRFKGRIPNLFDNYLRIDHLDRNAARAAITEPARTYNALHPGSSISIEPPLVEAVLDQVKTNEVVLGGGGRGVVEAASDLAADERIETSYLQLVMTRLWQEEVGAGSRTLRVATLDSLGGAKRIVQTHVDAVMERLEPDEQRTAAQLFYYLVTRDGTKIAHTVSALSEYTRTDETRLTGLLEKLCDKDARILQPVDPPPGQPDSPRYEIRHDKLAAAILDWRRRYAQMEERAEAERLAIKQRQEAEAQARVEEKAKSAARLRWLSIALAVMTVLALAGAALAFKQRGLAISDARESQRQKAIAEDQSKRAEEQRVRADAQSARATDQANLAEKERLRANEQADLAEKRATEADIAKGEAEAARGVADMERKRADQQAAIAKSRELAAASRSNLTTDPELSVLLALQAVSKFAKEPGIKETEKKEVIEALHEATQASRVRHTLKGHTESVSEVAYDPNGKFVITHGDDGAVKLWDANSGTWVRDLVKNAAGLGYRGVGRVLLSHHGGRVAIPIEGGAVEVQDLVSGATVLAVPSEDEQAGVMAFDKDDSMLAVANAKSLKVWTLATGKSLELPYELPLTIESLTFSDGGKRLVAGSCPRADRAGCTVFEASSWDLTKDPQSPQSIQVGIDNFKRPERVFSPTGDRLFTLTNDGTAKLWDTTSASDKELFDFSTSHVTFPATFSDDGKQLATLSENGSVLIWDLSAGRSTAMEGQFETKVTGKADARFSKGLAFSPNGKFIAAFAGKTVEVWDVNSKRQVMTLSGHKDSISSVAFTADGKFIATASIDGRAKMWDTSWRSELLVLTSPDEFFGFDGLRFSSDGKRLAGVLTNTAKVLDANSGKELDSILLHVNAVNSFAFSPDWKLVAFLNDDGVNIRDTSSHNSIWSEAKEAAYGCEIVFSPNGKLLAGGRGDVALVWDVQTGNELHAFKHESRVASVAFSPDGQKIATGSSDGTASFWDLKNGNELGTLKGQTASVSRVCFSPDGKYLITARENGHVEIWNISTGKEFMSLSGHSEVVNDITFSRDGKLIATASDDGTAKVWLANTGEELFSLDSHSGVKSAAFSPDRSRLVITNSNGDALVYTLDVEELINLAQQRISRRDLTEDERKRYLHEVKKE